MGPRRVERPRPVPPCRWDLDPELADEDGVVGVGADLDVDTLVGAYHRGVFPWPHVGVPLLWFSPDPRAVLPVDRFHVSRSLRRTLRHSALETTLDEDVAGVIAACAERDEGTWITAEMQDAYLELAALGWVHSVEVWDDAELVGGVYGVQIGGVLTGESMFHRRDAASKIALLDLCARFGEAGGRMIDVQLPTPHLESLGATPVPRESFLRVLRHEARRPCLMRADRLPVSRLAAL